MFMTNTQIPHKHTNTPKHQTQNPQTHKTKKTKQNNTQQKHTHNNNKTTTTNGPQTPDFNLNQPGAIQGRATASWFGCLSWTTEFADRKTWTNKTKAKAELYSFGGAVVTE